LYLKGIEVQGFKSFADKINLEFGQGITTIVGPNGSGKSNISDAIRWVMGEQSAKSLRGGNMQDVIFAGTQKRSPLGFAQVSIILDNRDNLETSKSEFVPENGCILPTVKVELDKNDTVFEVLKEVCEIYKIQLEYSWTPMYESYYIEGINNLYEFDCGYESGRMYKVNGWFPNYGCSSYELKDGDNIVWCYTCVGLGADVGAEGW